ncbi:SDR family oxidoreductase [Microbacterium sp.]|uniref:SDR family oxidoreductase n=1 Tax=Microbacterium sp. TaxID=51671 RepID=UPI003C7769AE
MIEQDLAGRRAIVTGGASGIGLACAQEFARRGAHVTIADLNAQAASTAAEEIGGKVWEVDLSDTSVLEGGPHGVTSNCINPGYVRAPLVEKQIADQARVHDIPESEVVERVMLTESAIKHLVEATQVASLAGWLVSDAAGMVTGASYTMDGGWSAR